MKTNFNNSDFENQLSIAIEKEKEVIFQNNRVDKIMDNVMELSLQTSFEDEGLNMKTAIVYGVSIVLAVNIGCIIGNLLDFSATSYSVGLELISFGFGSLLITI